LQWSPPSTRRHRRTRPRNSAKRLRLADRRTRRTLPLRHRARAPMRRQDARTPNDRISTQQPTTKQRQLIKATPKRTTLTALRPTPKWDRRLLLHQTKTPKQSPIRKGSSGPQMGATTQASFGAPDRPHAQILDGRSARLQTVSNASLGRSSCASADALVMQTSRPRHSMTNKMPTRTRPKPSSKWRVCSRNTKKAS